MGKEIFITGCPKCGGRIIEKDNRYSCENYPACNCSIWKNALQKQGIETLEAADAAALFELQCVPFYLTSKSGKLYKARVRYNRYTNRLEILFY